ncbi:MAG: IclR family transcriptional regulator [Aminipila sp.]
MEKEKDEKKIGAIEKTLMILNSFTEKPHIYSAKALSEKLGFSKPTVHRILNTLEAEKYIRRVSETKYTIGYKAYQMGMIYANNTDIYLEIRKVIDHMAKVTGEQIGYAVLEGTDVVSVYESQMQDSRIRYIAGAIYPINSGCYGKVLMAFSHTESELCRLVPNLELKQVSPGAIMDHKKLLEEYITIRRNGYGESSDEYLDGTLGLGVPVFKRDGELAGCIALGAIKSPRFDEQKKFYLEHLLKGASELKSIFL